MATFFCLGCFFAGLTGLLFFAAPFFDTTALGAGTSNSVKMPGLGFWLMNLGHIMGLATPICSGWRLTPPTTAVLMNAAMTASPASGITTPRPTRSAFCSVLTF